MMKEMMMMMIKPCWQQAPCWRKTGAARLLQSLYIPSIPASDCYVQGNVQLIQILYWLSPDPQIDKHRKIQKLYLPVPLYTCHTHSSLIFDLQSSVPCTFENIFAHSNQRGWTSPWYVTNVYWILLISKLYIILPCHFISVTSILFPNILICNDRIYVSPFHNYA